jgi:hypothetical protein
MRLRELITEGKNHPVIVVDVQPEYSGINDGYENPVFEEIIQFVTNQTGSVLMFVNAEETGVSGDTIDGIRQYWEDTLCDPDDMYDPETDEYQECDAINWSRFDIVDKGYGYFRSYMDQGVNEKHIIRLIRSMYQNKVSDIRELYETEEELQEFFGDAYEDWMPGESFSVEWTSVAQLKKFNGAYIVGGGRTECLREVELLMNAFNIKYKRIDSLVYG